jgi:hypothetical protein
MTIKTPNKPINLDRKETEALILAIRHFKDNAFRHKEKTDEDDYFVMACKLLAKFMK